MNDARQVWPDGRRYAGVRLRPNAGMDFPLGAVGVAVPDPDDVGRIIVVPLAAVRLVFSEDLRGAVPKVPEGW